MSTLVMVFNKLMSQSALSENLGKGESELGYEVHNKLSLPERRSLREELHEEVDMLDCDA